MTYTQFRMALAKLDMTQGYMAELLGLSARTVRTYALNEHKVPPPVQAIVHLMLAGKIRPHDLEKVWRKIETAERKQAA